MPLPIVDLPTGEVDIAGQKVEFRSLSREEAIRLRRFQALGAEDIGEAEVFVLTCAIGCTEEEAKAFRANSDMKTAEKVLQAIYEISGLVPDPEDPDEENPNPNP